MENLKWGEGEQPIIFQYVNECRMSSVWGCCCEGCRVCRLSWVQGVQGVRVNGEQDARCRLSSVQGYKVGVCGAGYSNMMAIKTFRMFIKCVFFSNFDDLPM